VARVSKNCLNDDYIAFVFGDRIHIMPMAEHLKKCGADGSATVTEYFPGAFR
jgi:hypothetical protein